MSTYFAAVRVAGALCHERLAAAPRAAQIGTRLGDTTPHRDMTGLLTEGNRAAASGDLRAAVRAFRQATYLDRNVAIAYLQLGAALEPAADAREARRAVVDARLALTCASGTED